MTSLTPPNDALTPGFHSIPQIRSTPKVLSLRSKMVSISSVKFLTPCSAEAGVCCLFSVSVLTTSLSHEVARVVEYGRFVVEVP